MVARDVAAASAAQQAEQPDWGESMAEEVLAAAEEEGESAEEEEGAAEREEPAAAAEEEEASAEQVELASPQATWDGLRGQIFGLAYAAAQGSAVPETTRMEVLHAVLGREPGATVSAPHLCFCITSLGRGYQLKAALAINLLLCLPFSDCVSFYLVLFTGTEAQAAEHQEFRQWFADHYGPLMDTPYLTVAECEMRYWNASVAKNTAHRLAIDTRGEESDLLINLDADNVLSAVWLREVPRRVAKSREAGRVVWRFGGDDGGCTGRIGVVSWVFEATNGYDEELPYPTGYQDIEFADRTARLGNPPKKEMINRPSCGWSVPNDADRKTALGPAKIKNTHPSYQRA